MQEPTDRAAGYRPQSELARRKGPSQKSALLGSMRALLLETTRLVSNEKVFPKRGRWVAAYDILQAARDFYRHVNRANGIEVRLYEEAVERHKEQTKALASLEDLDELVEFAQEALSINPDYFTTWANLFNEAKRTVQRWQRSDEKRYHIQLYLPAQTDR